MMLCPVCRHDVMEPQQPWGGYARDERHKYCGACHRQLDKREADAILIRMEDEKVITEEVPHD